MGGASTDLSAHEDVGSTTTASTVPGDHPPHIGPYHLVGVVGEGGMGIIYRAEQLHPVRRCVALKVIKLGMDTREVVARFAAEQQALALMDHPNVAHVYDAGATEQGRPYFAMEYVEGVPISRFCARHQLPTRKRLELVVQICNGVQHAHQKGIIHRDLKPSNILVTEVDQQPVPKVIDFGIAKATDHGQMGQTMFTRSGTFIGTPAYMSPEQAAGDPDIDTRTDVYSLGVILYELLTGALPLGAKQLKDAGADGLAKLIMEHEPAKPSVVITSISAREPETEHGSAHRTDLRTLRRELRGDLDWIILKAMEKDRRRRYETANGLAADIRRHLNNEPVTARPPTAGYRLSKLARKHKAAVATMAMVALALIVGLVGTTYGFIRASAERDKAVAAQQAELHERAIAAAAERERRLQLVDSLINATPQSVPAILDDLRATPDLVRPALHHNFDAATSASAKLRAACGLAAIGEPPATFLAMAISTSPDAESRNLIDALHAAGPGATVFLTKARSRWTDALTISRYAVALLSLGQPDGAEACLVNNADPTLRSTFISLFGTFHGDLIPAASLLESTKKGDTRSGLAAAIGKVDPSTLPSAERLAAVRALATIYHDAADAGSHSAAAWALRKWGHRVPPLLPTRTFVRGREWFANAEGLTMLRLRPGRYTTAFGQTVVITHPLFMSDCEISIEQFNRFVNDASVPSAERLIEWPGPDKSVGPTADCPVQRVNVYDAAAFCNWLSRREDRKPCYSLTVSSHGERACTVDMATDGYRLPTGAEWEYACRTGTTTPFPCGEDARYLQDYANIAQTSDLPCGSKLPNAWGFFDMIGNAWEICFDSQPPMTGRNFLINPFIAPRDKAIMRGGSFDAGTFHVRPSIIMDLPIERRGESIGFRVVCGPLERVKSE